MVAIYSTMTGEAIDAGMASGDEALARARREAVDSGETVILDDPEAGGEFLVGPRGGVRKFTRGLKLKMGFYDAREVA